MLQEDEAAKDIDTTPKPKAKKNAYLHCSRRGSFTARFVYWPSDLKSTRVAERETGCP